MKYNSVLDLHTHTIVSGHAYSTLREMAKAASDKGLELLGITEHAPKMPGTCHLFYFDNLRIVPRELYGIELVLGSEVNILDAKGTVDLPQKTMEKLDIIICIISMAHFRTPDIQAELFFPISQDMGFHVNLLGGFGNHKSDLTH